MLPRSGHGGKRPVHRAVRLGRMRFDIRRRAVPLRLGCVYRDVRYLERPSYRHVPPQVLVA